MCHRSSLSLHHKGISKATYIRIKKVLGNINSQGNGPCTHCHLSRQSVSQLDTWAIQRLSCQTFHPLKDGLIPWSFSVCNLADWRSWLSKASSKMISLVVDWKDFSIQHKWSISVHCLEFRKIPSAVLCNNVCDFFLSFFSFYGKSTPPNTQNGWFVSMWTLYVWLTKVGENCHTSKFLKEFWQMARTSPKRMKKAIIVFLSLLGEHKSDKMTRS